MTSFYKGEKLFKQPKELRDNTNNCHKFRVNDTNPDAQFMFLPAFTGNLKPSSPKVTFEGNCFQEITFEMTYDKATPDTFDITATLAKPRSLTCTDFFMFANTEIQHVEDFSTHGAHKMTFKATGADAIEDL